MADTSSHPAVERLLRQLDLDRLDRDLFRAPVPDDGHGTRLFGGQVAAQALRAATLTVDNDHHPHSLHGYFLRPGKFGTPLIMYVDYIRGGTSFTTRRVKAVQDGEAIFALSASFHKDEPGPDYHRGLPEGVPDPDSDEGWHESWLSTFNRDSPFEVKEIAPSEPDEQGRFEFTRRSWMRLRGPALEDRALNVCVAAYASDMGAVSAAVAASGVQHETMMAASLDHAMWFHQPIRMTDWFLYDLRPIRNSGARGLVLGAMYAQDGTHVVSVTQEALVRPRRDVGA